MQHRPQRRLQYLVLLLIALNCRAGYPQTPTSKNADAGHRQDFAGSELCAQCHEDGGEVGFQRRIGHRGPRNRQVPGAEVAGEPQAGQHDTPAPLRFTLRLTARLVLGRRAVGLRRDRLSREPA